MAGAASPDPGIPSEPEIHCDTPAKAVLGGASRREEPGDLLKGTLGSGDGPEERDGDCPRARPAGRWRTRLDVPCGSAEDSTTGRACRIRGRGVAPRGCGVLRRGCDHRVASSPLLTREGDKDDLDLSSALRVFERAA